MPRFSISSWSLHHLLGGARYEHADGRSGNLNNKSNVKAEVELLELPALVASKGIFTLEICHFHFPRTDEAYIAELRSAISSAQVSLFSILIDTGDITHPDKTKREEDLDLIRNWIVIAGKCGAEYARVVAGESDADSNGEVVRLSAGHLLELADFGKSHGVKILTENYKSLARRPEPLLEILDRCEGQVGLCADFGNYKGETKLSDLAAILPRATSIHTKADYGEDGKMDRDGFIRCMDLAKEAGFDGPYSLIFHDKGPDWECMNDLKQEVTPYL